jgi:outer membrane protein
MKKTTLAIALAAVVAAPSVLAFEKGDIIVRAGLTTVSPDESCSNVTVGGGDLGFGVNVDNNTQLGLNVAYFLMTNGTWNCLLQHHSSMTLM